MPLLYHKTVYYVIALLVYYVTTLYIPYLPVLTGAYRMLPYNRGMMSFSRRGVWLHRSGDYSSTASAVPLPFQGKVRRLKCLGIM